MALGANSYGDTSEIAALTPMHITGGAFDGTTRPTLTQVESLTDQVSGIINVVLAENGFAIPVTQADAKLMLDFFTNEEVAAIVEGINGSGRFGPSVKNPGSRRRLLVFKDVREFIEENAAGIEELGATRTRNFAAGIAYRDTDNSGNATFPLFEREGFGNDFDEWDSAT